MDYREAGVNIEEGIRAVSRYQELAGETLVSSGLHRAVLNGIGGFAGMFAIGDIIASRRMEDPVLVSGTDGVGTKLEIALAMKKYTTVGIDCVAMCVNDILCQGARPLFFLDYLACGKLDAGVAAALVRGVATGCREAGCVLLGGETAEMPGFYGEGKYDIAGFALGIVDRKDIVDGSAVREGDVLIGVLSSGPHSNGYSLIRRAVPSMDEDFGGAPIGAVLLEPTRIYVKPVLGLLGETPVHGMAHITGGGFFENIPRMFGGGSPPPGPVTDRACPPCGGNAVPGVSAARQTVQAEKPAAPPSLAAQTPSRGGSFDALVDCGAWTVPPIFNRIAAGAAETGVTGAAAEKAGAELLGSDAELRKEMFSTFNMGIGFVIALDRAGAKTALEYLDGQGFPAREIGTVVPGEGRVRFL